MAALARLRLRRLLRRNRIFRDRTHPFETFDDETVFKKFRFRRQDTVTTTDIIERDITASNRTGSLTPLLQVLVTLRYFDSGAFQDICGELIGVNQLTVSSAVTRVTDALLRQVPYNAKLPARREAQKTKAIFFFFLPKVQFPKCFWLHRRNPDSHSSAT